MKTIVKLILLIAGLSILFLCFTAQALDWNNNTVFYPQNEVQVMSNDASGTNVFNLSTFYNSSLTNIVSSYQTGTIWGFASYSIPCYEFNMSELPCNSTVSNVSFNFTSNYQINSGGYYNFYNITNQTDPKLFNQSSTSDLWYNVWYRGGLITNVNRTWFIPFLATGVPCVFNNLTSNTTGVDDTGSDQSEAVGYASEHYDGFWFKKLFKQMIMNSSSSSPNFLVQFGIYCTQFAGNQTINTSLSPSSVSPQKPCLLVNYSYNLSICNSTKLQNNSEVLNGQNFTFNLSNTKGNRIKYKLHLYDISTGTYRNLTQTILTAWTGTDYNYTLDYTFTGLIPGRHYILWIEIPGNLSSSRWYFDAGPVVQPTSRNNVTIPTTSEGYVKNNSGVYTKYDTWSDLLGSLYASRATGSSLYQRPYLEYNLSHFLPVDANVTFYMNLNYYSISVNVPTNNPTAMWVLLDNHKTANSSTAEDIFVNATSGKSMQSGTVFTHWFTAASYYNKSTLGLPIDIHHQGWWMIDDGFNYPGSEHALNESIMTNLSNGMDRILISLYTSVGGVGGFDASGLMASSRNTSSHGPTLTINYSYNISENNNTYMPFANNSENVSITPTVYFNVSNNQSTPITYYVMLYNTSNHSWTEQTFVRRASDGNKSCLLKDANYYGIEYYWYLQVVGNNTITLYHFTTFGPATAYPPTNVICHDYNSSTVNFTFTPFQWSTYGTSTVCYYQAGSTAPTYGAGTYGGNFTGNGTTGWLNITGLSKSTEYTFAFWTYINSTFFSTSMLSIDATIVTNTTVYGIVNFIFRYENVSTSNTNELINQTRNSLNGTHQLIIKYLNATDTVQYMDWSTYASNGYTMNTSMTLTQEPYTYEFTWNYSINSTSTEFSGQFKRLLLPYADTYDSAGNEYCTFYIPTCLHVYNQYYYLANSTDNISYILENQITGNIVPYSFIFEDRAGYFDPANAYQVYSTIFKYVGYTKVILDQRYIDSSGRITPNLLYQSYPFVSIYSKTTEDYINDFYSTMPPLSTESITAPYDTTIIIYPIPTAYQKVLSTLSTLYKRTNESFWYLFTDTSNSVSYINMSVFNATNGTFLYGKTVNLQSTYNFSYASTDAWGSNITYKVVINFTYRVPTSAGGYFSRNYSYSFYLFPEMWHTTMSANYFDYMMENIFGPEPFYNPNPNAANQQITYFSLVFGIIGGIVLSMFFIERGHPTLGALSGAIYYGGIASGSFIVDADPMFATVAVLLGLIFLIYGFIKGGG